MTSRSPRAPGSTFLNRKARGPLGKFVISLLLLLLLLLLFLFPSFEEESEYLPESIPSASGL